jgi:hypothetical protein
MLAAQPQGGDLGRDQVTRLLAAYGVELWPSRAVASPEEAIAAAEDFGWDVVLKATADHLRERPDQAHVVSHIVSAAEMTDAWRELTQAVGEPDPARGTGFIVQPNARPGVPITIRTTEDPLFGPVISFGMAGPLSELVGDRSYRIPPLTHRDAAAMVREVKAAPLLFGYRGADVVDVDEVERLIRRVAQLQNDLPQISMLELGLVLVGLEGAAVLTAGARIDPVDDPRSDWFVRRLNAPATDTLPS